MHKQKTKSRNEKYTEAGYFNVETRNREKPWGNTFYYETRVQGKNILQSSQAFYRTQILVNHF